MEELSPESRSFLLELYTQTGGDTDVQVSMYDIGTAVGLEKNEAGALAESLFIQGAAELKTLSGGIGITSSGISALDMKPARPEEASYRLPDTPVLDTADIDRVTELINEVKSAVCCTTRDYREHEELVLDIKCLDIQLLSPRPKTRVVRTLFQAIKDGLEPGTASGLAARIDTLTG